MLSSYSVHYFGNKLDTHSQKRKSSNNRNKKLHLPQFGKQDYGGRYSATRISFQNILRNVFQERNRSNSYTIRKFRKDKKRTKLTFARRAHVNASIRNSRILRLQLFCAHLQKSHRHFAHPIRKIAEIAVVKTRFSQCATAYCSRNGRAWAL